MKTQNLLFSTFILLILSSTSCDEKNSYRYSEIKARYINDFVTGYREYCNLDLTSNFELNAVQCSFYGDYQNALEQATQREMIIHDPNSDINDETGDKAQMIKTLEAALQNPHTAENDRASIQKMLDVVTAPAAGELFAQAEAVSAVDFIVSKASDFHFTLINEAHFNSQHRSFTQALLKPLWNLGYRYLALETLSYEDKDLQVRGYPLISTGYYTKDSNFGNLVREALALGYQLVPYETQSNHDGTLRDRDQAHNLYEQTWKKDKKGKVLIHAGYSHISEMGDTRYEPMGYQLKKLVEQDILTIDQVVMVNLNEPGKQHQYYREVVERFDLLEPTIFLNNQGKIIVDPVNAFGIDIQVYHPKTHFELGRPNWMKKEGLRPISLSIELLNYQGSLIQAMRKGEKMDAVPVDQFVIAEEKAFLLGVGAYELRIINCKGDLIGILELEVD